jgi:hypothetical protein
MNSKRARASGHSPRTAPWVIAHCAVHRSGKSAATVNCLLIGQPAPFCHLARHMLNGPEIAFLGA